MHIFRHFATITRHRHRVMANCFRVGIGWQGLFHDLSKYSAAEFWVGARHYLGNRSPNEEERRLYGYSLAWMHHKGRNRHHFEYWTDYDPVTKQMEPVKMPLRYVAEMFCDRVAASRIYRGAAYTDADPLAYFLGGKPRRRIHPETSALLEGWLTMLAEQGEASTFAHVRQMVKKGKY